MDSTPLVSCVCVCGKSPRDLEVFVPQAIGQFHNQTWPWERRELLLVSEHPVPAEHGVQGVRSIYRPDATSLGELRNAGLDEARGDFVIQWDSDDFHHPRRVEIQVRVSLAHGNSASFLHRQLCYDLTTSTAFIRQFDQTFIHGSICHPKSPARYPLLGREEDTKFLESWPSKVVIDNDPRLYVRFYHGENTWDRAHVMRGYAGDWAKGKWHLCDEHRAYLRSVLADYPQHVSSAIMT